MKFARYLSSPEVSKMQAILASHLPVFPSVYKDPEVLKANPWFADALPVVETRQVAAGVAAQYPQVSDVDPQQHERVPRRHEDHRRRARRHEEPAEAAVPLRHAPSPAKAARAAGVSGQRTPIDARPSPALQGEGVIA